MKIYIIKSTQSKVPLAEIRVEGDQIEFIVDNSNGAVPKMANNSFKELSRKVSASSHLSLEEPTKSSITMFRYILSNGDVAEISSDGHTCILNGKILEPEEKDALFAAIKRGEISVNRKADGIQQYPIMPSIKPTEKKQQKNFISKAALDNIRKEQKQAIEAGKLSTPEYDYEIESGDYRGAESPNYVKRILYKLKYGTSPRRLDQ